MKDRLNHHIYHPLGTALHMGWYGVDGGDGDLARMRHSMDHSATSRSRAAPLDSTYIGVASGKPPLLAGSMLLANTPLWFLLYQVIALNALLVLCVMMHNAAARRIAAAIGE